MTKLLGSSSSSSGYGNELPAQERLLPSVSTRSTSKQNGDADGRGEEGRHQHSWQHSQRWDGAPLWEEYIQRSLSKRLKHTRVRGARDEELGPREGIKEGDANAQQTVENCLLSQAGKVATTNRGEKHKDFRTYAHAARRERRSSARYLEV